MPRPAAIVAGGETTVTVTGYGRGGRNQELVLSAAEKIRDLEGVAMASVGTDGVDGASEAAGAIVDGKTYQRSRSEGLNPVTFLKDNDSYGFFSQLEDAIHTGLTGTNVNDLMVLVAL